MRKTGGADISTMTFSLVLCFIGVVAMKHNWIGLGIPLFLVGGSLMCMCIYVDFRYANRWRRRARKARCNKR